MTVKEKAIKIIQDLSDSGAWADIEERIRFLAAIDKGLAVPIWVSSPCHDSKATCN